jgi:2-(1,2-epoxy-1,2-dihydrophenyl)acetyl-CoA isomerase
MSTETNDLLFTLEDRVATLTLNRPDRLNALSEPMFDAAIAHLHRCATDPDVGAIVLTGAGRAFCAGGDVAAMSARGGAGATFEDHVDRQREIHELSWLLAEIPKVTIAAVNGAAAGAGLGIALSCDLCFASDRARFGTAFAKVGFGGDFGTTWQLTHRVGPAKAKELFFLAEMLPADEAARLGLVNRVFPHDTFVAEVGQIAARIAHGPLVSYRYMKQNVNLAVTSDFRTLLDREAITHLRCGRRPTTRRASPRSSRSASRASGAGERDAHPAGGARRARPRARRRGALRGLRPRGRLPRSRVGEFGLVNAVMPVGTTFLEVVSPMRDGTTAGRFLERRGGDGGYMVILQTAELDADRARLAALGVRIVWEVTLDDIATIHLHPRDIGGAIVSLDQPRPPKSWRWGGPEWQSKARTDVVRAIASVTLESAEPERLAARWAEVLGVPPSGAGEIALEPGLLRFSRGSGEGSRPWASSPWTRRARSPRRATGGSGSRDGASWIAGVRFELE